MLIFSHNTLLSYYNSFFLHSSWNKLTMLYPKIIPLNHTLYILLYCLTWTLHCLNFIFIYQKMRFFFKRNQFHIFFCFVGNSYVFHIYNKTDKHIQPTAFADTICPITSNCKQNKNCECERAINLNVGTKQLQILHYLHNCIIECTRKSL